MFKINFMNNLKKKFGFKSIYLEPISKEDVTVIEKALTLFSQTLKIKEQQIGLNEIILDINPNNKLGFYIENNQPSIKFKSIKELTHFSHEWFHFIDYKLNLHNQKDLNAKPVYTSETNNSHFSKIIDLLKEQNTIDKEQQINIIKKYLPSIDERTINKIRNGNYEDIQLFTGKKYLISEIMSINSSIEKASEIFDFNITNNKYYSQPTEMCARAFEKCVNSKLGLDNNIAQANYFSLIYPQNELLEKIKNEFNLIIPKLLDEISLNSRVGNMLEKFRNNKTSSKLKYGDKTA